MPSFDPLDLVLLLGAAAFALWELYALLTSRGKISLKGKVFGRPISVILLGVLAAAALWMRRSDFDNILPVGVAVGAAFVLYIPQPSGLCDDGLYHNGKFIPYVKLHYYSAERETDKGFSLRMSTGTKDYIIDFTQEQKPLVIAHMNKGKVADFNDVVKGGKLK